MSCLFQSLSSFVSHQDFVKLRQDICDFLQTNPKLVGGEIDLKKITELDDTTIENYVGHMRSNSTWGGAIEIRAFCEMYDVNVVVKNIRNAAQNEEETYIEFLCSNNKNRWVVISWNGGHFEPILFHNGDITNVK